MWTYLCPKCNVLCETFDDYGIEYAYCPKCFQAYNIDTGEELNEGEPNWLDDPDHERTE